MSRGIHLPSLRFLHSLCCRLSLPVTCSNHVDLHQWALLTRNMLWVKLEQAHFRVAPVLGMLVTSFATTYRVRLAREATQKVTMRHNHNVLLFAVPEVLTHPLRTGLQGCCIGR